MSVEERLATLGLKLPGPPTPVGNAVPDFERQEAVIDGASDLLQRLFGEAGRHTRSLAGVNALPSNVSAEIELVVELMTSVDLSTLTRAGPEKVRMTTAAVGDAERGGK
jgi:hypothetical protein